VLKRLQDARRNDEGFTLIELLVVIIVLGILAGIAVFGVAQFRTDATKAACKASVKTVQTAADAYNAQTGAYPADVAVLITAGYLKAPAPVPAVAIVAGVADGGC
jgi:prepilin-type N-terminal cleavage/methylation domain-containing protein